MDGPNASVIHVVDGDPAVRDSLTTLLDLNGFRVESYSTAAAFLKRAATSGEWVVCEADLPDGSGIELFAKVRAADANTPFILLVSRRSPSIIATARNAGIELICQKPLVHRNLIACIENRPH